MFAIKLIITVLIAYIFQQQHQQLLALAENVALNHPSITDELNTCEEQLSKYRKFLLKAIISFEDVCDAYNIANESVSPLRDDINNDGTSSSSLAAAPASQLFYRNYQPSEQRSEIWAFFKLLMAQFNDLEFTNVIREAVVQRCRVKSALQRDEKRNAVVLGKKQRFHSWGGKRASLLGAGIGNAVGGTSGIGGGTALYAPDEHNGDHTYFI